jgi:3-oxoacyl-[acyl-carrier-protein] synthase-3
MPIGIELIEYYLPEKYLLNEDFIHLGIDPKFMSEKIGIEKRFIAAKNESVGDMAVKAANKLFIKNNISPSSIDTLILCTQNPDYLLPTTACIVQDKLGLPKTSMCFDINLGCSGFVYSLGVAFSLINTFKFENVLIITSEAYSKVISYEDKTTATLFSDVAAAILVRKDSSFSQLIDFNFGTDGSGFKNLIVPVSGSRIRRTENTAIMKEYSPGVKRSDENLFMDGHEITKFAFKEIPKSINEILRKTNLSYELIDRFFFHQANKYMLVSLTERMNLPPEKVYIDLSMGNTVSSTIPIALKNYYSDKKNDETIIICGFGVGYSWASSILKIKSNFRRN